MSRQLTVPTTPRSSPGPDEAKLKHPAKSTPLAKAAHAEVGKRIQESKKPQSYKGQLEAVMNFLSHLDTDESLLLNIIKQYDQGKLERLSLKLTELLREAASTRVQSLFRWSELYYLQIDYDEIVRRLRTAEGGRAVEQVEFVVVYALEQLAYQANQLKDMTSNSNRIPDRTSDADPLPSTTTAAVSAEQENGTTESLTCTNSDDPDAREQAPGVSGEEAKRVLSEFKLGFLKPRWIDTSTSTSPDEEKGPPLTWTHGLPLKRNTLYKPHIDKGIDLFALSDVLGAEAKSEEGQHVQEGDRGERKVVLTCVQVKYGTTPIGYRSENKTDSFALQTIRDRFNEGKKYLCESLRKAKMLKDVSGIDTAEGSQGNITLEVNYVLIAPGGIRRCVWQDKKNIRVSTGPNMVTITIPKARDHKVLFSDICKDLLGGNLGPVLSELQGEALEVREEDENLAKEISQEVG